MIEYSDISLFLRMRWCWVPWYPFNGDGGISLHCTCRKWYGIEYNGVSFLCSEWGGVEYACMRLFCEGWYHFTLWEMRWFSVYCWFTVYSIYVIGIFHNLIFMVLIVCMHVWLCECMCTKCFVCFNNGYGKK